MIGDARSVPLAGIFAAHCFSHTPKERVVYHRLQLFFDVVVLNFRKISLWNGYANTRAAAVTWHAPIPPQMVLQTGPGSASTRQLSQPPVGGLAKNPIGVTFCSHLIFLDFFGSRSTLFSFALSFCDADLTSWQDLCQEKSSKLATWVKKFSHVYFLSFLECDPGQLDLGRSGVASLLTAWHGSTPAAGRVPGVPIRDFAGSCNSSVQMCTTMNAIDVTEKAIIERLYLVSGRRKFALSINCPCAFTPPTAYCVANSRFSCLFHPRGPSFFCSARFAK